jgi:hypothetical protein
VEASPASPRWDHGLRACHPLGPRADRPPSGRCTRTSCTQGAPPSRRGSAWPWWIAPRERRPPPAEEVGMGSCLDRKAGARERPSRGRARQGRSKRPSCPHRCRAQSSDGRWRGRSQSAQRWRWSGAAAGTQGPRLSAGGSGEGRGGEPGAGPDTRLLPLVALLRPAGSRPLTRKSSVEAQGCHPGALLRLGSSVPLPEASVANPSAVPSGALMSTATSSFWM